MLERKEGGKASREQFITGNGTAKTRDNKEAVV